MRFLIDVCASSRKLLTELTDLGHDVVSALEIDPRASDEALLFLALDEQRTIVTQDKDFGELVFVHRLRHPCIIRFVEMGVDEKVAAMTELLQEYVGSIRQGTLIVVTSSRVRIRQTEPE